MAQTEEGSFKLKDGTDLYTKTWKPDGPPTAILVFLHGFSDHCNAYYTLFPTLASTYSIQTHGLDQRGWGRSVQTPSSRGLTGPTTLVLSDIHEFILSVSSTTSPFNIPLFLMGHSMGGAQALHYLLTTTLPTPRPQISGLILESPYIALHPSSQPYALTVALGSLAAHLLPNKQLLQKLPAKFVSRSPTVQEDWTNDTLCHDTGTLAGLSGMLQRAAQLTSLSNRQSVANLTTQLPCAVWLGHGTEDFLTSHPASQKLFDVLEAKGGDKTFKSYEGAYHKLHAEPEGVGEEFARDVGEWIVSRAKRETKKTGSQSRQSTSSVGAAKL